MGPKLLLMALVPAGCLLVLTALSGLSDIRAAHRLSDLRRTTRLSFAAADIADDLARERLAFVLVSADPGPPRTAQLAAAKRATTRALQVAAQQARATHIAVDAAGQLDAARRQRAALLSKVATGSLTKPEIAAEYSSLISAMLDTVRALELNGGTFASARAADAYISVRGGAEAAAREEADIAAMLAVHGPRARPAPSQWATLETLQLSGFRARAPDTVKTELDAVLNSRSGRTVESIRNALASDPTQAVRETSLRDWLSVSGTRLKGLRSLADGAQGRLDAVVSDAASAARDRAVRDLGLSLAVLIAVTALGLVLRSSITCPLREVSEASRRVARGDLSAEIAYTGSDEIGEVATAFRGLHATAAHLADEVRAMNDAVKENRLDYRAEAGPSAGAWAQLLAGMNDTIAAFVELQDHRQRAERQADRVFDMSLDLLCVAGYDGYFKRVNPALERLLGYPTETLLSRPTVDFVHPEDRATQTEAHATLERGDAVRRFELRQLCGDGSVRRVEWNAQPVDEEQLIYAVGRDVTETRRAAAEHAALRRVATLVAKAVSPTEIFGAVAQAVGDLFDTGSADVLRYEPNGGVTVLGSASARASRPTHGDVAVAVALASRATRMADSVGAPIVVEDRLWGVIVVSADNEPLPPDAEARITDFTELVATAIANAESRAELTASRSRVVAASDEARRGIERNLHDSVQQRLIALEFKLRGVIAMLPAGSPELGTLEDVSKDITGAFEQLRDITRGIHPAALTEGGLTVALRALARRSTVSATLDLDPVGRLPAPLEIAAYYVASEALTNAAKHARASVVAVELSSKDSTLGLTIRDNGIGGVHGRSGSGLVGLADRVEAIGGRFRVTSPPGGGTLLQATFPLDPAAPASADPGLNDVVVAECVADPRRPTTTE